MSDKIEVCPCGIACGKTHPLCAIEQIRALRHDLERQMDIGNAECNRAEAAEAKVRAYRELFGAAEAIRLICHRKGFDGTDECRAHRRMELAQGRVAELEGMQRFVNMDGSVTLHPLDGSARMVDASPVVSGETAGGVEQ